uniref:DUF19 domain-containing protein n=2 Tax=Acrobeloides nanus TaxID=290746 RepID=A0A914C5Q1_9BILA
MAMDAVEASYGYMCGTGYRQFEEHAGCFAEDCTKPVKCQSMAMDAVEASYGYMCGTGYRQFEEHAGCFAEVESQKEYVECKNAASSSMNDALKLRVESSDIYFERLCSIMDNYLRCCRPLVYDKCGKSAWKLVSQITIDSLHVTMPTCDVNRALL